LTSAAALPIDVPRRSMVVTRTRAVFFFAPLVEQTFAVAPLCKTLVDGAVLENLTSTSELMMVVFICFNFSLWEKEGRLNA
jgi:hypothetical protein